MFICRITCIQGNSVHQLVRAKDCKQAKCLLKGDWLINDNISNTMKYFAAVTKNEEALRVVLWKSTQVNLYVKKVKEDTEF